jgi:DNA-binding MarR family transcriptional regulator
MRRPTTASAPAYQHPCLVLTWFDRKPAVPASSLPLQRQDYVALATFRYALRKFLRFSKEFLASQARLTPEQYEALLALESFAGDMGLPVGQLSELLQVRHHTAVALTNRLVARGLVTKKRSSIDRREVYVRLNSHGRRLLRAVAGAHHDALRAHSSEMITALRHVQKKR